MVAEGADKGFSAVVVRALYNAAACSRRRAWISM